MHKWTIDKVNSLVFWQYLLKGWRAQLGSSHYHSWKFVGVSYVTELFVFDAPQTLSVNLSLLGRSLSTVLAYYVKLPRPNLQLLPGVSPHPLLSYYILEVRSFPPHVSNIMFMLTEHKLKERWIVCNGSQHSIRMKQINELIEGVITYCHCHIQGNKNCYGHASGVISSDLKGHITHPPCLLIFLVFLSSKLDWPHMHIMHVNLPYVGENKKRAATSTTCK